MNTNKRILILSAILAFSATNLVVEEKKSYGVIPDSPLNKPANTWQANDIVIFTPGTRGSHLGPTGLWGTPMGQNILVRNIDSGSPAYGKVMREDIIYGANGKGFPADRDIIYSFSMAITEAETKAAGGKLVLDIRRDGKLIKVPIQLKVMGSFSATTPWNCEKSENIVARAEAYLYKGLRPETGIHNDGKYMYAPWHDSVHFMMAAGNPKMQGLVRRHIRNTIDDIDRWKSWDPKSPFQSYKGWGNANVKFLFGEYYHLTGDPSVLPYLEPGAFDRGHNPKAKEPVRRVQKKMDWSWPPTEPTAYGTHPHGHMAGTMGDVLANEAGVNVNQKKLLFDLKYLYVKRAEFGHVRYHGYGAKPIEIRQTDKPEEIAEELMRTGTFSAMNGKPAMAAALFSMVDGHEKAVRYCSRRSVYAFNRTHKGHGGIWFNGFWTPIGASHAGPEKFQHFMKGQQWWRELYRDHTGAMWQVGNAKEKKDTLGTGFAIHRVIPRRKLRMLGAPRSMFGPSAPAYMKEALAAHRDRDYARAVQLTRQLQSQGKVPANDKDRVAHFLSSVKTLKESIDHDLDFTESLLSRQNYTLAAIELSQLKMVVSPDDARLKAIAEVVASKKDQIVTREQIRSRLGAAARETFGTAKNAKKDAFRREKANTLTLVKDGAKYAARNMRKGTFYATFPKNELPKWSLHVMKHEDKAPAGWEKPAFDDSKWKKVTLPVVVRSQRAGLLRTHFDVKDASAFKTLRIHGMAREQENMTIYLNGEIVAMAAEVPGSILFDLKPSALKLLKAGKNTLAIKTHRKYHKHGFSIRLDGIPQDPSKPVAQATQKKKAVKKKEDSKKKVVSLTRSAPESGSVSGSESGAKLSQPADHPITAKPEAAVNPQVNRTLKNAIVGDIFKFQTGLPRPTGIYKLVNAPAGMVINAKTGLVLMKARSKHVGRHKVGVIELARGGKRETKLEFTVEVKTR